MVRFVADRQEPTFEVIEELLMDKSIKFSMLAGQGPVLERVKEELTMYWMKKAKKGRSIEEVARFKKWVNFLYSLFAFRFYGHPEMADFVINERERRA